MEMARLFEVAEGWVLVNAGWDKARRAETAVTLGVPTMVAPVTPADAKIVAWLATNVVAKVETNELVVSVVAV